MALIDMTKVLRYSSLQKEDVEGFNYYIDDAQQCFFKDIRRTFNGTEDDILLAKRAIAILTAYYIRRHRGEIDYAKVELEEYDRMLKKFIYDADKKTSYHYFQPRISVVTQEDIGDTSR